MAIADVLELIEISQGRRSITAGNLWQDSSAMQQQSLPDKTEPLVMVVDDSITVRELLSLSFGKLGYRVEQARDGQEAWDKLRAGLPCDMIFCDIEMPRMNGLELLSNIQKDEKLNQVPIAMLTSRGAEKHRKLAADLGATAYLTKPYTEKDLMDVAKRMLEGEILLSDSKRAILKAKAQQKLEHPEQIKPQTWLKSEPMVLIIDDSVTVRELLAMTYKKAGYQVEQARDGQEAYEKLQSGLPCDLIVCDIEMPRMNGLELLSQLQEDNKLNQIPVAMLTSRGAEKHRKMAADRGAKGYLTKPYIEEVLLDVSKRLMAGEILLDKQSLI
jgi:chemosensory pili system protein ChpA (sensor histidine kinase/response regulator)